MIEIPTPPHAYIPGQTPRHPEGWFDPIRHTVEPEAGEAALAASQAFQAGLTYLQQGYYWEAHEVLEPVWMACPQGSETRRFVQGLIQLANARLKRRMLRPKAALRLYDIAIGHFDSIVSETSLGQPVDPFRATATREKAEI